MATLERSITSKESLEFLTKVFKSYPHLGANLNNHRKTPRSQDTYQFTIDKMSDTIIDTMMSDDTIGVKDVMYHPLVSPQGYGISLRYRMYVVYEKIQIKRRVRKK